MDRILSIVAFSFLAACRPSSRPTASDGEAGLSTSPLPAVTVAADSTADARRWVELYYPGWAMADVPPDRIDWSSVTDVVLFGLVPVKANVSLSATTLTTEKIARSTSAARAGGVDVLVCLGGEKTGRAFAESIEGDGGEKLASSVSAFVIEHVLDGVVLDIEPLAEVTPRALASFVRLLRERSRSGAKPWRLEAVVAPDGAEIARLEPIAKSFDRIAIMSYLRSLGPKDEGELVAKLRARGVRSQDIGVGRDARSLRQTDTDAGVILWHAGTICARGDAGTRCKPSPDGP